VTDDEILPTRLAGEDPPFPPGTTWPPDAPLPTVWEAPLRFTGAGGEYFRIWVVNTLLTLLTLGLYSPWAKVRKTRWFWRNTQLDGVAFQYHGDPLAILRGRIIALALLAAYSLSGHLARAVSLTILAALGALAPWLFMKSQRFKLANSSWRGLRFAFDSTAGQAYAAVLPAVLLWLGLAAAGGAAVSHPALFAVIALAFALSVPGLHARLKRYQHGHARYGSIRFQLDRCTGAFYWLYLKAALAMLGFGVAGGLVVAATVMTRGEPRSAELSWPILLAGYGLVFLGYLVVGPFFAARAQQVVWPRTHGGPIRFATRIAAWPLLKVVVRNVLLTLVTLGLYWPFAAVALARYRIECASLRSSAPLESVAAGVPADPAAAVGEGAMDLFGLDIGL
jgi:uncharacterized membrane protein YjgN (DUF898 family)